MSLTSIMNSANSGLQVAQAQIRVVSDNVANVNTTGYVRKIVDQRSVSIEGLGAGVEVARVRLATDRFLQAATLRASADAASAAVRYELLDGMQSLFGDPTSSDFFSLADKFFATLGVTAEDPLSSPRRLEAITCAQALLDEAARISAGIQSSRLDADSRISSAVSEINTLLEGIENLNREISRASVAGGDTSGAESAQAQLIDQLAQYMDVRIQQRPTGGVILRTGDGMLLAGQGGHATIEYKAAGTVAGQTDFSEIWLTEPNGQKRPLLDHLTSGEIRGLVEYRDVEAQQVAERLSEVMSRLVREVNAVHNAYSAAPAPATLTGRNTGLDLATAISGFTGVTNIAVTNADGVIQRRVEIDFTAGTMSVDGGAATAFTPGNFLSSLNAALGTYGSAGFSNGALSLNATGGNGVSIGNDVSNPSLKAGRSFSAFFGMNDLIQSNSITDYDTGLRTTDPHGFTAGETITFRFSSPAGSRLRDISVVVPPGGSMADLITALNDPSTGAGRYGAFALDANGKLAFQPAAGSTARMSIIDDTTSRGPGGPSFSALFGVDPGTRSARAATFSIRADIERDPNLLALAMLDLSAPPGETALSRGDGRGGRALADVAEKATVFGAAGGNAGGSMSLQRYFADLAGDIGARSSAANSRKTAADALITEAASRRASFEGVNLDEELVKLTTFQQAFNASARMIQAAKDMYDVLLGMA